jgi:TatD DNase family protein
MPSWIDTHCHLDASEFSGLTLEVRRRAREAEVELCVLPAVEVNNFGRVRQLAHDFGDVYALGIHPLYTGRAADADLTTLATALQAQRDDPRLVALGEIGLDFFVPGLDGARQSHFYEGQLKLARHFELPLILHVRRSADALLRSLRALRPAAGWRGIAHAFNGSQQQAMAFVDLGFKLGFGGAVTFERALQLRRLAASLPPEAIVLETDAPDIPPHWLYRTAAQRAAGQAQGLNQPAELPRIAGVVARLRDVTLEQLARQTSHNAAEALPRLAGLLVPAGA